MSELLEVIEKEAELKKEYLDRKIDCLDHGFVRLVDFMGTDASIVQAARVSYGKGTTKKSQDRTLIRYLMRHRHCYHPDMQVLTMSGWKCWKDCRESETFLVPDPTTRALKPELLSVQRFPVFEEKMYNFKNERMSYCVTSEHRMYFKNKYKDQFEIVRVEDMKKWGHFDPLAGYKMFNKDDVTPDPQYELLGFFLGDGHNASPNRWSFHLKKVREKLFLSSCIEKTGLDMKTSPSRTYEDANVYWVTVSNSIRDIYNKHISGDKCFDLSTVGDLTPSQILGLFRGLCFSDGSFKKDRPQIEYASYRYNLLELFSLLGAIQGYDVHNVQNKGQNAISVNAYKESGRTTLESRKQYHFNSEFSGEVYCATTSTGLLIVRGNNTKFGFVCGNTSPFEMVEFKFHCIAGDTRVSTDLGIVKIEDALDAAYTYNTTDISECNVVCSGKKNVYKINLERGFSIKVTADHRVLVFGRTASLVWKKVQDLATDDYLVLSTEDCFFCEKDYYFLSVKRSKQTHKTRNVRVPIKLTRELSELIGYYMGDGSSYNDTLEFPVSEKYPQIANRIVSLIKTVFNVTPAKNISDGMIKVRLNSVEILKWWRTNHLEKNGARNAFIPKCFWISKKEMAYSFFAGLFGADGSVSETNGVNLTTTSQRLAEETQKLMAFLGIPMTKIYRPDNYILYTFTNDGLSRYRKHIGFTCDLKNDKLSRLKLLFSRTEAMPHARAIIEKYSLDRKNLKSQYYHGCNLPREYCPQEFDGKICLSILDIEHMGKEKVWDVSVPKTEMFLADGIIVHNCKLPIFCARQWVR